MSTGIMERLLQQGLNADRDLASKGYTAVAGTGASGGVTVERRGHVRGVWQWQGGVFVLTPSGSSEPAVEVETVAEAIHYTREVLCREP